MAQRLHIDLECDFCGVINGSVATHPHSPDGKAIVETDACSACWAPYQEAFDRLAAAGRTQRVAENQRARVKKMAAAVGGAMTRRVQAAVPAETPVIVAKSASKKSTPSKAAQKQSASSKSAAKSSGKTPAKKTATRKTAAKKTTAGRSPKAAASR